jgi:hypothetical protein
MLVAARSSTSAFDFALVAMRGLRTNRTAQIIVTGHAFVQNIRRGHYELAHHTTAALRVAAAFTELATAI